MTGSLNWEGANQDSPNPLRMKSRFRPVYSRRLCALSRVGRCDDSFSNSTLQQVSSNIDTSAPKTDPAAYRILLKIGENKCLL
jgi:hypothetical protein